MAYTTDDTCKYAKSHEWIRVSDNIATVGISDYAQQELGDIVYVEFPEVGDVVTQGEPCGIVESVKAASDFYAPVSGEVIAVNNTLEDAPETVNEDPYGDAWLIQVRLSSPEQLDSLLTPEQYRAWVEEEAEGGH